MNPIVTPTQEEGSDGNGDSVIMKEMSHLLIDKCMDYYIIMHMHCEVVMERNH